MHLHAQEYFKKYGLQVVVFCLIVWSLVSHLVMIFFQHINIS